MIDRLEQAIYNTGHDFPGGVPAIAKRINAKSVGTLNNIFESRAIMLNTGNHEILYVLAHELGYGCYELGDWSNCSDVELISKITEVGMRRGEVDKAIHESLKNGEIDQDERRRIHQAVEAVTRANLEMLSRIDALTVTDGSRERTKGRCVMKDAPFPKGPLEDAALTILKRLNRADDPLYQVRFDCCEKLYKRTHSQLQRRIKIGRQRREKGQPIQKCKLCGHEQQARTVKLAKQLAKPKKPLSAFAAGPTWPVPPSVFGAHE